jgi:hypothetical protein
MLREGIEKDATYSRKKEVNYLRQQFSQFNEDQQEQEYLQTFNVSHGAALAKHSAPREKVDTVFPEPQERNRHWQKEEWSLLPFLESVKVPVPMTELTKVKSFSDVIKSTFFPEVDCSDDLPEEEDESGRDELSIHLRTQIRGKPPANRAPEESAESDDEGEEKSPEPPTRRSVRKTGTFTNLVRIRQMSDEEFDKYNVDEKKQVSPAIKVGAYLGDFFIQEILVDIGADCNLVDLKTAKKIIKK